VQLFFSGSLVENRIKATSPRTTSCEKLHTPPAPNLPPERGRNAASHDDPHMRQIIENIAIAPSSFCSRAILIVLYHESKLPYLSCNTLYVSRINHQASTL
jgi:hypothetical protein